MKEKESFDKKAENFAENDGNIAEIQLEEILDENDEEILKFLTENEEIYMDFDFIPEIASTDIEFESRLISETTEPSPNFEPSETTKFETKMEQQKLWERQISELSSIIANYDPTKPAPPPF